MVLKLLDEIQQYRLESNVISLNAVRHARREGSGGIVLLKLLDECSSADGNCDALECV